MARIAVVQWFACKETSPISFHYHIVKVFARFRKIAAYCCSVVDEIDIHNLRALFEVNMSIDTPKTYTSTYRET